jgi:hypothetical protein
MFGNSSGIGELDLRAARSLVASTPDGEAGSGGGHQIQSFDAWKMRLCTALEAAAKRPLVLVLGDGLARDEGGGVWSVERVRRALDQDYDIRATAGSGGDSGALDYGERMARVQGQRGQDDVNKLVRRAVLSACNLAEEDPRRRDALEGLPFACERLMTNPGDWHSPKGIAALADVMAHIQRVPQGVLCGHRTAARRDDQL